MYDQSIDLSPTGEAYVGKASVYRNKGMLDEALETLEEARHLDPHDIYIDLEFGHVANERLNYSEAMQSYQQAIARAPNNLDTLYSYGALSLRMEKNEEAAKAFQQALMFEPRHVESLYGLGIVESRSHNSIVA